MDSFHWFEPKSARELARRIALAGDALARLEVRIDDSQAHRPMTFRVVTNHPATDADAVTPTGPFGADINESWLCPPICPGGGGGG